VSIDFSWRKDPGVFVAAMELKSGADPKVAESALYAEILKVVTHGVTEREVQKAKNNLSAQMLRELSTNSGRAHALGHYEALLGSWKSAFELQGRYEQITAAQVQAAAMKYLRDSFRSVVTLVPTDKGNA
jgi:predicted Zn-dependent peptidase